VNLTGSLWMKSSFVITWLENMTSSGARLIRVELTMDMYRFETKEEFFK
jgi:hypothetical protein